MQAETKFNAKVKARLVAEYPDAYVFKTQMVALRGIPDILACIRGKFIALEGKMNDQDLKKNAGRIVLQRYNIMQIRKAGGFGEFITPTNMDEVFSRMGSYLNADKDKAD